MKPTNKSLTTPVAVLHVVDSLERGGLERLVNDLALRQQTDGWTSAVFSIQPTQGYRAELEAAGIPVIVGNKQGTLDFHVLRLLRDTVRRLGITVIHAHNFVPSYYAALATLGMRNRPAQVVTCHDMGARLSNRRLRMLFSWSLRRTQRVAMVGRQVHERFVRDGFVPAHQAVTLLNAVPVERFTLTPERRARARAELDLHDDDVVVGCVGRMFELKNHKGIIRVWPQVLAACPKARLVILGEGPLRERLTAQAAELGVTDRVTFAGLRTNVADLLPGFDVFALPSFTEGVSIALLEACATGLASVASRVGGNVEVIEDGVTGRLFDVQSDQGLVDALVPLLTDIEARQRLGARAQDWVRHHASLDALHWQYSELYRQALALT